ncbi:MAG: hypothetical protein K9H26_17020 [Prolixibacteraceae bacterium]|nr:hypothetical protein [Prolixibacteraceae bacterium]
MERIVLEVDDSIARKWRSSSYKLRSKLNKFIGNQIGELLDKSESEDTVRFFNELRVEMEDKGLTQEKLDEILRDE